MPTRKLKKSDIRVAYYPNVDAVHIEQFEDVYGDGKNGRNHYIVLGARDELDELIDALTAAKALIKEETSPYAEQRNVS